MAVAASPDGWRVALPGGTHVHADGVVLAGPAPEMATLVEGVDAGLARRLAGIAYASSATVTLAWLMVCTTVLEVLPVNSVSPL